jgi:cell division topological specificity factor
MSLIASLIDYLRGSRPKSANIARERLQIILAHEGGRNAPDYLPALRQDIIAVLAKYVPIDPEQVKMHVGRHDGYDLLELDIVLPEKADQQH